MPKKAVSRKMNLDDLIKEAVFSVILHVQVKMYRPESNDWHPEVVLRGIETYKHVTLLNQLDTAKRKQVLDTLFVLPVLLNVCVSPPLPKLQNGAAASNQQLKLNVLFRQKFELQIMSNATVAQLRSQVNQLSSVAGESFSLWFNGMPMSDPDCTLAWHGVADGNIIEVRPRVRGGDLPKLVGLDANLFCPEFDYNFTDVDETGKKFMRGGLEYHRPIGWKRYAMNVLERYEDGNWLGSTGSAESGEWAVSYHGTRTVKSVQSIVNTGYDPSKTVRNAFGFDDEHKVYSTPLVTTAEKFASFVNCSGSKYKFVFQNRINPNDMQTTDDAVDPYWGAGMDSLRSYGLLVKKSKTIDPDASTDASDE